MPRLAPPTQGRAAPGRARRRRPAQRQGSRPPRARHRCARGGRSACGAGDGRAGHGCRRGLLNAGGGARHWAEDEGRAGAAGGAAATARATSDTCCACASATPTAPSPPLPAPVRTPTGLCTGLRCCVGCVRRLCPAAVGARLRCALSAMLRLAADPVLVPHRASAQGSCRRGWRDGVQWG